MQSLKSKLNTVLRAGVVSVMLMPAAAALAATPPPVFNWAQRAGGTDFDYGAAIGTDTNGNVYVAGQVLSSISDFGPFPFSAGSALAKYNSQGNIQSVRRIATGANAGSLAIDAAGNVFLTGN